MNEDPYQDFFGRKPPFHPTSEVWGKLILETFDLINKKINSAFYLVPEEAFTIIHLSAFFIEPNEWAARFKRYRSSALEYFRTPEGVWRIIAHGLYISQIEGACKKLIPNFDLATYNDRIITRSPLHKIAPVVTPTPSPIIKPKKSIPRLIKPRALTVSEYILRKAPSEKYELLYQTVLRHYNRGLSEMGKKVYSKGWNYMIKATKLKRSTFARAWAWLKKEGIFNKARNENPDKDRCSFWYVCTSIKQVYYFRDPENRHRKSKFHN